MTYDEALDWLRGHYNVEASGLTRAMPTLDRVSALLELLGEPQHQISIIHVTGTNGKGSAARMVVELLTEHGLSVGGYASPHIERINERFTLDNEPVTDETFAEIIAPIANVESLLDVDSAPSYFEVMVAAAFAWFVEAVDVAVVEVGAGGRWDATNVGDGEVAVVTNVALDHLEYFGPTLRDVATEKAGIVKPKSHLVLGETDPSLAAIFLAPANAGAWQREVDFACEDNFVAVGGRSVTLRTPGAIYEDVFLPVHGSHQGDNAAVALAAVEAFFARPADADVVTEAFAKVTAPGRFEVMARHPLVILDGAHNAHGAEAAARTLDEDFSAAGPPILVAGFNQGRDPTEMLEALGARRAERVIACAADWARAIDASEVAAAATGLGAMTEQESSVAAAVDRAIDVAGEDGTVLIAGSLYVVGEARSQLS